MTELNVPVLLSSTDGEAPEVELLYTGRFTHGKFGKLEVTEADLDKAVANFDARMASGQADVALDFDHSHAEGRGSKAAGWLTALRREGNKLKARVAWTSEAAQAIKDRAYRYLSAEFSNNGKNEAGDELGFTLLGGALTNRPFLRALAPIALSDGTGGISLVDRDDAEALDQVVLAVAESRGVTYTDALDRVLADDADARQVEEWRGREDVDPEALAQHERILERAAQDGISYVEALDRELAA